MSIASLPRPGAGGVPIIPEDAVDPVLPADPPIDVHLEEEDGVAPGFGLPPAAPADPPEDYLPPAPSLRSGLSHRGGDDGDASSLGGSSQLPGRRLRPHVDALAPILAVHQVPLVTALTADLVRETAGRELFSAFVEEDFHTAAMTFVRYRLSTLAIARQTDRDARRMFLADLRDLERKAFPEMQLLTQLLPHFAPVQKQRVGPKDPTFEEVALPVKLKEYEADFSPLGGFLKPNQTMANFISKELIREELRLQFFLRPFGYGPGKVHLNFPRTGWRKGGSKCRHIRPTLRRMSQLFPGRCLQLNTQLPWPGGKRTRGRRRTLLVRSPFR